MSGRPLAAKWTNSARKDHNIPVARGGGVAYISREIATSREELATFIERIVARGWSPATAGNFSVRLPGEPLRMLISPSGVDKAFLKPSDLLDIPLGEEGLAGMGKPSAEYLLHVAAYEELGINSVLHVHTVWNTMLSREYLPLGKLELSGYELLKAFSGVTSHEHTEIIPVLANSQNMVELASQLRSTLKQHPQAHGFLLAGHGLYTWGDSISSAYRHLEAFEFLFELYARETSRTGR